MATPQATPKRSPTANTTSPVPFPAPPIPPTPLTIPPLPSLAALPAQLQAQLASIPTLAGDDPSRAITTEEHADWLKLAAGLQKVQQLCEKMAGGGEEAGLGEVASTSRILKSNMMFLTTHVAWMEYRMRQRKREEGGSGGRMMVRKGRRNTVGLSGWRVKEQEETRVVMERSYDDGRDDDDDSLGESGRTSDIGDSEAYLLEEEDGTGLFGRARKPTLVRRVKKRVVALFQKLKIKRSRK